LKLLYILSEYLPDSGGGIITFYANLLPRLLERGHKVKVLVANHSSLDRSERIENGVEVEYLKSSFVDEARLGCKKFRNDALWAYMPLAWGAYQQAKGGEGFDIVEATDWALLFMPWVVSTRKAKVVVSLHGSNGQVDWYSNPESHGFDGDVLRLAEVATLRLADSIHANSRANAEFWKTKLDREIRVIPPVFVGFEALDHGRSEIEDRATTKYTKGNEKGEEVLTTDSTDEHGYDVGHCLGKPSGAVFTNSSTGELAQYSENTLPTRTASGPADALRAGGGGMGSVERNQIADLAGFLEGQSQSGLPMDSQKNQSIREANDLGAPGNDFESVTIRVITGQEASVDSHATSYSPLATAQQAPMGLVVGRLQNWKGAEVLCKALELLEDMQIEWVGRDTSWGNSGETASGYLEKNYPSVWGSKLIWRGPLEHAEAMEKISNAAFFVVPSIWDVFNLTAAEAMARRVPVICSRNAGAEMLIEDGRNGFLFNSERPEELAVCLRKISALRIDEKDILVKNGQDSLKHITGEWDVLKKMEESYLQTVNKDGSTMTDAWLASFLTPGSPEATTQKDGWVHRAIWKAGRILAHVS
jgi:glycosyltransferase involved in cell wall biosynthesis